MEDRLLTPSEIAERLQVHEKTVHRWLNAGKLKGIKLEKYWRIEPQELESFLNQHKAHSR